MIVTCAIIEFQGKILVCRRSPKSVFPGFWEFPGGKLEEGETVEECLEREIFEELGVCVRAERILGAVSFPDKPYDCRLVAIQAKMIGGKLNPVVHDRIEWVFKEKLVSKRFLPADIFLIKKIKFGS